MYGSLGWPPKFQHWFLEFEHCVFEVECMTSALDEMVRSFVLTILALDDEVGAGDSGEWNQSQSEASSYESEESKLKFQNKG